eukprot:CAMPEP_0202453946 /NCGR_PEP_ID=MMETSP1360-20130828/11801_1 /ASSEMBLY_ACC=CAM_ASM_000848 /TAXON_ID=515479 /ORGANISM="Licmophora paradoxa, Strain CCMP2313" /LENGTH=253 /DNA_ID=CAMNT_0049073149 /DNA_START=163 /DNA_END=922 /DNA_ORIENTATION=+
MNSSSSSGVTVGGGVGGVTITILATTAALAVVSTIASMVLSSSSTSSTSTSSSKKEQEQEVVEVTLPQWAHQADYFSNNNNNSTNPYQSDDARMRLAIELSARNVRENTGGPFGCAIFHKDLTTGIYTLSSIGVNRVVPLGNSTLHGEMVAIQMAQKKIGSFSLRGNNNNDNPHTYELSHPVNPAPCVSERSSGRASPGWSARLPNRTPPPSDSMRDPSTRNRTNIYKTPAFPSPEGCSNKRVPESCKNTDEW